MSIPKKYDLTCCLSNELSFIEVSCTIRKTGKICLLLQYMRFFVQDSAYGYDLADIFFLSDTM